MSPGIEPLQRLDETEESAPMSGIRLLPGAAAIAGIFLAWSVAFGQPQAPAPAETAPSATPPAGESQPAAPAPAASVPAATSDKKSLTITSGSTMTKWKWQEVKAKWAREKGKWTDCRSQAKEQKLHGPKSWHFMADCMIKVAHPQPAESDKTAR
jgi:hypothetical protein